MSDGTAYEYELRDLFKNELGGGGIRVNSSGSGTKDDLPDILGTVDGVLYACELKYRGKGQNYARFKREETKDLLEFASTWNAEPCFVGRFWRDTDFYVRRHYQMAEIPELTEHDSFAIKRGNRDDYDTLTEVVEEQRSQRAELRQAASSPA